MSKRMGKPGGARRTGLSGGSAGGSGSGAAKGAKRGTRKRSVQYTKRKPAQFSSQGPGAPQNQRGGGEAVPVKRGFVDSEAAARSARDGVAAVLDYYALPRGFDARTEQEAEAVAAWDIAQEAESRTDLRGLCTVTIDGADARDFDDAISVERAEEMGEGCVRLGVHIADVSWYVRPGTTLDMQAQRRATSVYLPDRVLPMLPEALSNGCCSLLPDEDRLTLSVLIECGPEGEVRGYTLARSVIRSRARLVYDDVNQVLHGDVQQGERYAVLLPDLQRMAALAARLRSARFAKGALDFDVDEAEISVDAQGEPTDIRVRPRGAAERMIEEFMLLANQVVAQHVKARSLPCLYRVHEPMEMEKAAALSTFVRGLGLRLRGVGSGVTPQALQQMLKDAEGRPDYPVIAQMALRAMQKARYDAQPLGHYGLATEDYCHFTAPIRRYPDLFVHRMLGAEMSGELRYCERGMRATAPSLADHCSERERAAMEAERAVEKLMMARYMAQHIGEVFEGLIVSVVEWGFYVALPNMVEGLVPIRTLPGFWALNREQHCLVGAGDEPASAGRVFRLGQEVRIRVESVDIGARQIDFVLADEGRIPRRGRGAGRA